MESLLDKWTITQNGDGTITVVSRSGYGGVVVREDDTESIASNILHMMATDIIELS